MLFLKTLILRQGKCINYNYGGCFGTKNLFDTQDECETKCPSQINAPRTSTMWIQPPFCKEPPIQGNIQCMGHSQKYTFDSTRGQCVPYSYGGCHGTQNLFDSEAECQKTCDIDYNDDTLNYKLIGEYP